MKRNRRYLQVYQVLTVYNKLHIHLVWRVWVPYWYIGFSWDACMVNIWQWKLLMQNTSMFALCMHHSCWISSQSTSIVAYSSTAYTASLLVCQSWTSAKRIGSVGITVLIHLPSIHLVMLHAAYSGCYLIFFSACFLLPLQRVSSLDAELAQLRGQSSAPLTPMSIQPSLNTSGVSWH